VAWASPISRNAQSWCCRAAAREAAQKIIDETPGLAEKLTDAGRKALFGSGNDPVLPQAVTWRYTCCPADQHRLTLASTLKSQNDDIGRHRRTQQSWQTGNEMKKLLACLAFSAIAAGACGSAVAGGVNVGVGIYVDPPVRPYYPPVVQYEPRYVPAPVYYPPQEVYVDPGWRERREWRERRDDEWRREEWRRRNWREHRHHHDDDD
jgi:hypothetical protein